MDLLILPMEKNDTEIRWKKTKNGFHRHGKIIYSYMVLE